jgi:hypothetical protein
VKNPNTYLFIFISILFSQSALASGTSEQYFWIWVVLLSPIWGSFIIWMIAQRKKEVERQNREEGQKQELEGKD